MIMIKKPEILVRFRSNRDYIYGLTAYHKLRYIEVFSRNIPCAQLVKLHTSSATRVSISDLYELPLGDPV